MRLPFHSWLARAVLPLAGVAASVVLLTAAAAASAVGALTLDERLALFAAGALAWILAIAWGTWVNGRPRREASRGAP